MATVKKTTKKAKTEVSTSGESVPAFRSRAERIAAGKALRETVPRESHPHLRGPDGARDHAALVKAVRSGRLEVLVE